MSDEAAAQDDARLWVGRVEPGREEDHARFVEWLGTPEAESIFWRRRLTEYRLSERAEAGGIQVVVVFQTPRSADPRPAIEFLRYPGLWPDFWQFERGGRASASPLPEEAGATPRVHWRRPAVYRAPATTEREN